MVNLQSADTHSCSRPCEECGHIWQNERLGAVRVLLLLATCSLGATGNMLTGRYWQHAYWALLATCLLGATGNMLTGRYRQHAYWLLATCLLATGNMLTGRYRQHAHWALLATCSLGATGNMLTGRYRQHAYWALPATCSLATGNMLTGQWWLSHCRLQLTFHCSNQFQSPITVAFCNKTEISLNSPRQYTSIE